jgi:hypothetical protein
VTRAPLLVAALYCLLLPWAPCHADLIWFDGSESEGGPPGKLLSDNEGYWGDSVLTGVEYTCVPEPNNPPDRWRDTPDRYGRRLLDGRPHGNWWTPIGTTGPLAVTFDFKRACAFTEVDLDTRCNRVAVTVETADSAGGPWTAVLERPREDCPDQPFHRLPLARPASGRYLRLTVEAEGVTYLEEVLAWGDAEVSDDTPEAYRPVTPPPLASEIAFTSIPGIEKTTFPDAAFWGWQRQAGPAARQRAVWSEVSTWDSITDKPLLPALADIRREVRLTTARNETECVALALTNTSWERPWETEVALSPFRPAGATAGDTPELVGGVRVAGAIGSRNYGVNLGPLFAADNLLPPGLMRRYLTNGAGIEGFPRLTLSRAGSAVLWVSVTSQGAPPGQYVARLTCSGGPSVLLRVEVLDVTLPRPRVWLQTWSGTTSQFPFTHDDRDRREVAYKASLGATVWSGWPEPGSVPALAREPGRSFFHIWGIGDYGHRLYGGSIDPAKLTAEDEASIAEMIRGHVAKAESLGLSYDDWYVELTDEPGKGNSPAFGALCRLIRQADPKVRIYCNPSFWVGNGVLGDGDVYEALGPWYNDCVDISSPIYLLLRDRPQCMTLFGAERLVRGFYDVCTQSAKSERAAQVEHYRRLAWDAYGYGWNGWGFYSYYAPRGNPWSDFDAEWYTGEDMPDYQMVYPGPHGPVPTRQSEAVREGWEDYCLLTLLRSQGGEAEVQALLADYAAGKAPAELRQRALRAAAE